MHPIYYFLNEFGTGISIKDLELEYSRRFEMNQDQNL